MLLARLLLGAVVAAGLVACGDDDEPAAPLELPAGDACGDAFFWAATAAGDVAVTVYIDASDRSPDEPTTEAFVVPDPSVVVEVLRGANLGRNFCTDLIAAASEPRSRQAAVAGTGTISLDPVPEDLGLACGTVSGELELTDLRAEDGTTFAPIRVTSDSIGCYSG